MASDGSVYNPATKCRAASYSMVRDYNGDAATGLVPGVVQAIGRAELMGLLHSMTTAKEGSCAVDSQHVVNQYKKIREHLEIMEKIDELGISDDALCRKKIFWARRTKPSHDLLRHLEAHARAQCNFAVSKIKAANSMKEIEDLPCGTSQEIHERLGNLNADWGGDDRVPEGHARQLSGGRRGHNARVHSSPEVHCERFKEGDRAPLSFKCQGDPSRC